MYRNACINWHCCMWEINVYKCLFKLLFLHVRGQPWQSDQPNKFIEMLVQTSIAACERPANSLEISVPVGGKFRLCRWKVFSQKTRIFISMYIVTYSYSFICMPTWISFSKTGILANPWHYFRKRIFWLEKIYRVAIFCWRLIPSQRSWPLRGRIQICFFFALN